MIAPRLALGLLVFSALGCERAHALRPGAPSAGHIMLQRSSGPDPISIFGGALAAWFRPDAGNVVLSGSNVTQVNDKSANGNQLGSSHNPTWAADGGNGKPAITHVAASTQNLVDFTPTGFSGAGGVAGFCIMIKATANQDGDPIGIYGGGNDVDFLRWVAAGTSATARWNESGANDSNQSFTYGTAYHAYCVYQTASNRRFDIDRTNKFSGATVTVAAAIDTIRINGNQDFSGTWQDVVMFNAATTTAAIGQYYDYLNGYYGTSF